MSENEKQIEEMACTMCGNKNICVGEGVEKCILYPQMRRYADRAYREGYRKQKRGEWISVEERLPEDVYGNIRKKITVLVCSESGKVSMASRQRKFEFISTKCEWKELDIFEWSKGKRVTHWMPLPEPPKGE